MGFEQATKKKMSVSLWPIEPKFNRFRPRGFRVSFSCLILLVFSNAWGGDVVQAPAQSLEPLLGTLTSERSWKEASAALQVVSVRTGEEVFARGADKTLIPASTMKVVTAATALRHLGPSYTFKTRVFTMGTVSDGRLEGDLHVQGGGDPTLVIEKLWKLVYDLRLDGISTIDGDIVYDEAFFSPGYVIPGWSKREDLEKGPSYFAAIGALGLNFGTVAFVVGPGAEAGTPGLVTMETPAEPYITSSNELMTIGPTGRRSVTLERTIDDDHMRFTVTGKVVQGDDPGRYYRAVADPTAYFMATFASLCRQVGIEVRGKHRRGGVPADAELMIERYSPPLGSILMDMNKYSSNYIAEMVLRTMAAEVRGEGSTDVALDMVREYLSSLGVARDSYTVVNGSGLSLESRLAPSHLTAVLLDMAADPRVGHEFMASLSIAGQDGTLLTRLNEEPGRLRGKTGTIQGIHCLTGFVEGQSGEVFAFAFLVNQIHGGVARVKALHDEFARRMFNASGVD